MYRGHDRVNSDGGIIRTAFQFYGINIVYFTQMFTLSSQLRYSTKINKHSNFTTINYLSSDDFLVLREKRFQEQLTRVSYPVIVEKNIIVLSSVVHEAVTWHACLRAWLFDIVPAILYRYCERRNVAHVTRH